MQLSPTLDFCIPTKMRPELDRFGHRNKKLDTIHMVFLVDCFD